MEIEVFYRHCEGASSNTSLRGSEATAATTYLRTPPRSRHCEGAKRPRQPHTCEHLPDHVIAREQSDRGNHILANTFPITSLRGSEATAATTYLRTPSRTRHCEGAKRPRQPHTCDRAPSYFFAFLRPYNPPIIPPITAKTTIRRQSKNPPHDSSTTLSSTTPFAANNFAAQSLLAARLHSN